MNERLNFRNLSIEGFGSIDRADFNLDRPGIQLVKGVNGAGKTTLFSALTWCVYGVPLKDLNKEDLQTWPEFRPDSWLGTRVVVNFELGADIYAIARHIGYRGTTEGVTGKDSLMLFESDGQTWSIVSEGRHNSDVQEMINKLMGVDAKMFLNSILFGQRMKRLIEASGQEKRQLFEELFEMDFIESAKTKAKEKKEELANANGAAEHALEMLEHEIENEENRLRETNELIEKFEEQKAERVRKADERVQAKTEYIEKLKEDLKPLKKRQKELKTVPSTTDAKKAWEASSEKRAELKTKHTNLDGLIKKTETEILDVQDSIERLNKDLEGVATSCPTCEQALPKTKVSAAKKAIKDKIKAEWKIVETQDGLLTKHKEAAGKAFEELQEEQKREEKLQEIYEHSDNLNEEKRDVERSIENKLESIDTAKDELEGLVKDYKDIQAEKLDTIDPEKLATKIAELEFRKTSEREELDKSLLLEEKYTWWIKTGFSAGGIKAFVFSAMLEQLNRYVHEYAKRMGVSVRFSVDMSKASKPFITECYKSGVLVKYGALSGGEKQRIDIAMAMAMHDLVTDTGSFNVLIMDEVFEGLDDEGKESAFDLIRQKAEGGKSVYVVTHSTILDSLTTKEITVTKPSEGETIFN